MTRSPIAHLAARRDELLTALKHGHVPAWAREAVVAALVQAIDAYEARSARMARTNREQSRELYDKILRAAGPMPKRGGFTVEEIARTALDRITERPLLHGFTEDTIPDIRTCEKAAEHASIGVRDSSATVPVTASIARST